MCIGWVMFGIFAQGFCLLCTKQKCQTIAKICDLGQRPKSREKYRKMRKLRNKFCQVRKVLHFFFAGALFCRTNENRGIKKSKGPFRSVQRSPWGLAPGPVSGFPPPLRQGGSLQPPEEAHGCGKISRLKLTQKAKVAGNWFEGNSRLSFRPAPEWRRFF